MSGARSVCVVVPMLNEARYVQQSMESLLAQDYTPLDVVVYDAGSTDGTLEVLSRMPVRVEVVKGLGQMAAINRGWREASADYVGWWAGDDIMYPGAIRRLAEALDANPDAAFAQAGANIIDADDRLIRRVPARFVGLSDLMVGFSIVPQSTLIRRSALERSGMMDEGRRLVADWDLFLRLSLVSPGVSVDYCASARRMHPGSEDAQDLLAGAKAVGSVFDAFFARTDLNAAQRAMEPRARAAAELHVAWAHAVAGRKGDAVACILRAERLWPGSLPFTDAGRRAAGRLLLGNRGFERLKRLKRLRHRGVS